jgi:YfiH family protein
VSVTAPFYALGEHLAIDLPGARAVFTSRRGGVSEPPYDSLNLGILTDDDPAAVARNRALVADELGVVPVFLRQVHGATVLRLSADRGAPSGGAAVADGHATATPGVAPAVLVADCLPIVIAAHGAVAVVHAGWRGLAGGVIAEGVRAVRELGGEGPIAVAIGPGAGACCYETGEEVHAAFAHHGAGVRKGDNADLKAIAMLEASISGAEIVHDVGICTICCDPGLLYSHRRERGATGRQAGIAWLT